jgi:hypothetical protein
MVTAIDLLDVESGPQFARCKKSRNIVKAAVPMSCAIHRKRILVVDNRNILLDL